MDDCNIIMTMSYHNFKHIPPSNIYTAAPHEGRKCRNKRTILMQRKLFLHTTCLWQEHFTRSVFVVSVMQKVQFVESLCGCF